MRQAGRYLPEYRLLRARHSFEELCKTPELACEVSLQPWQRFGVDAVIVFSDILFVPEAMGQRLTFKKEGGPVLSPILKNGEDVKRLRPVDARNAFGFVYEAIWLLKKKLKDVPVIGFSGAPWTLAYYMTGDEADGWIKERPEVLKELLEKLTAVVGDYIHYQQEAGADAIQLFDTWAGELKEKDFNEFALPYIKGAIERGKKLVPHVIYSRRCRHILKGLADSGADVVSIDPETPMEEAIKKIGGRAALQGNIDPRSLLRSPGLVKQETERLLSKIGGRPGHIINLGHGVLPTTPLECVEAFVDTVKALTHEK
jgi:uroporphyrinogen decarboxylase